MGAEYTALSQDVEAPWSEKLEQSSRRDSSRKYKLLFFLILSLNIICGLFVVFKPPFEYICAADEETKENSSARTGTGKSLLKSQELFSHGRNPNQYPDQEMSRSYVESWTKDDHISRRQTFHGRSFSKEQYLEFT
jgi:hypothetical protein